MKLLCLNLEFGNSFDDITEFVQIPINKEQSEEIEIILNKFEPEQEIK